MHTIVEKEWTTKAGLRAVVVMTTMATRNGYVEFTPETMLEYYCYSIQFEDIEKWTPELIAKQRKVNALEVHGGPSFIGTLKGGMKAIGFDCGHAWDAPNWDEADVLFGDDEDYLKFRETRKSMTVYPDEEQRSLEYVIEQCELLAAQLKEI